MSYHNVQEGMREYLTDNNAWKVIDYEGSNTGAEPGAAPAGNYLVML